MNLLSKKLRTAREQAGLTQQQAADVSGIGYKTINNYENGASRPDVDKLAKLCQVYGVSADFFINPCSEQEMLVLSSAEKAMIYKYRKLNTHGRQMVDFVMETEYNRLYVKDFSKEKVLLQCVIPMAELDNGISFNHQRAAIIEVSRTSLTQHADYAVQTITNNLEPVFFRGDILAIAKQPVSHNEIGVFLIEGVQYIRQLYDREGVKKLLPFNLDRQTLLVSPNQSFQCLGKVLGVIRGEIGILEEQSPLDPKRHPAFEVEYE